MATATPLLTTIIPTYNRAERLAGAIDSVLAQTYPHWQLIVVDDGSTDATEALVRGKRDDRIDYIYQTNAELSAARNSGMSHVRGDYFGFLDDDDLLLPHHFASLASAINTDGRRHRVYRGHSNLRYPDGREEPSPSFRINDQDRLVSYWRHPCNLLGMLFDTQAVRGYRFNTRQLLLEDFCWVNRVLAEHPMYQLDVTTNVYAVYPGQRSANYLNDELFRMNLSELARAYNFGDVPQRVPWEYYRLQALHQYMHYVRKLIGKGRRIKAAKLYREGLSYARPSEWKELAVTGVKLFI